MNCIVKLSLIVVLTYCEYAAYALPIGFGRNLRELKYEEIVSPNFYLYFDARTPQEGQAFANAAEAARPIMAKWFKTSRQSPLPIILSATTTNPSFANFITDALELQTLGQGGRDLLWHEYTHNMMYLYLENIFGPTGSIIHLPWLPAWWIEGLAESTSHSVGSDMMYGIERTIALENAWPSYDKLHSLYSSDFSLVGYGVAGAFVSYILRTYGADKLNLIMEDFFDYTLPWWWPWSIVPFNDFMPMDAALANHTGKIGSELYEEYKAKATLYWQQHSQGNYYEYDSLKANTSVAIPTPHEKLIAGSSIRFSAISGLQARQGELYDLRTTDHGTGEFQIIWNEGDRNIPDRLTQQLPEAISYPRITYGDLTIVSKNTIDDDREPHYVFYELKGKKLIKRLHRNAYVLRLFATDTDIYWLEMQQELTRLCTLSKKAFLSPKNPSKVTCPLTTRFPTSLEFIGESFNATGSRVEQIWLSEKTETLFGDRHRILNFNTGTNLTRNFPYPLGGKPLSLAEYAQSYFVLTSNHTEQFIRVLNKQGTCVEEYALANLAYKIYPLKDDRLGVMFRSIKYKSFWLLGKDPRGFKPRRCSPSGQPSSPLQYAMSHPQASFEEALRANHPWIPSTINHENQRRIAASPALHEYPRKPARREAQWRGRPVFSFPWIGADALGYQFGAISVPLMDHMQNETLSLSTLYGINSQFPNVELTFSSNRFATTYNISLFRRQTWNGFLRHSYYFDERGGELSLSRYFSSFRLSLEGGYKASYMLPYLGDPFIWNDSRVAKGYINLFHLSGSKSWSIGSDRLSYSTSLIVAPEQINDNFKYDKLSLALNYSSLITVNSMQTVQRLGLSYGRTRGKRRPLLREIYRPLKTFVPGSGGGFNEINETFLGPGLLTGAKRGDTQARFNWAWTFPLIRHLDTLIHIFYLERLDFSAFFNYGYAWTQNIAPHPRDFIKAHGYNLDLQSDIKGVTVNLGLGVGQVLERDWEAYAKFGFDALIGN